MAQSAIFVGPVIAKTKKRSLGRLKMVDKRRGTGVAFQNKRQKRKNSIKRSDRPEEPSLARLDNSGLRKQNLKHLHRLRPQAQAKLLSFRARGSLAVEVGPQRIRPPLVISKSLYSCSALCLFAVPYTYSRCPILTRSALYLLAVLLYLLAVLLYLVLVLLNLITVIPKMAENAAKQRVPTGLTRKQKSPYALQYLDF